MSTTQLSASEEGLGKTPSGEGDATASAPPAPTLTRPSLRVRPGPATSIQNGKSVAKHDISGSSNLTLAYSMSPLMAVMRLSVSHADVSLGTRSGRRSGGGGGQRPRAGLNPLLPLARLDCPPLNRRAISREIESSRIIDLVRRIDRSVIVLHTTS